MQSRPFHDIVDIQISYLKNFDGVMKTNLLGTYKKIMWYTLNEFEKPLMSAVFYNGRQWRSFKDKFLYLPK